MDSLTRVLSGFGLSFASREVAHLDLVQESTTPTWSALPPGERDGLLRRDLRFLSWQLRTFPIRTVICTSRTAGDQVQALLDVTVTGEDRLKLVTWWVGHATLDDRRVDVAGWNIPLARATGLGAAGEDELGRRLAVPDFLTYRSLHRGTAASLDAAGITVWWVHEDGTIRV